jgi:DHA1 family multidrug resistance protein-like MFS transporter
MNLQTTQAPAAANWKRTLTIMFFAQTITAIGFSSIFPFLPLYVESLGSSTGLGTELLAGLVFSAQAFTMMIASPIWGSLADRWGRKLMVERAMFGGTILLGLMAFARSAEELVVLRAIQGLITGTIGAANALVAATAPRARAGYAMGLMQVGMGLGVGIGPVMGGAIADAYGYPAAFYATAALLAIAGGIVLFGVKEDFVPQQQASQRPGIIGEWRRLLSAPGVILVYVLRFINHMGRMIFIPILPMFLLALLVSPQRVNSFTGLVVGIAAAATTAFAVFLGRLGDRIGHRRILIVCSFCCFAFFTLQALVAGGWQLLLLQALTGMALGGIVPGISALLANFTRHGDEGTAYGLDNSIVSAARMVGPMLGVGIGMWLGLRAVFVAAALLYLVAAALALWGLPKTAAETSTTQR